MSSSTSITPIPTSLNTTLDYGSQGSFAPSTNTQPTNQIIATQPVLPTIPMYMADGKFWIRGFLL